MKFTIFYILLTLLSCNSSKNVNQDKKETGSYLVEEISSINNWNIIYVTKQDSIYKIVTKKEDNKNCEKIMIGKSYKFKLNSRKKNVPEINGVKIRPINSLDIHCYSYDSETDICIEPEKGVYDLYHTDNIKGLCYIATNLE